MVCDMPGMRAGFAPYLYLSLFLAFITLTDSLHSLFLTEPKSLDYALHDFQSKYSLGNDLLYHELDLIDFESLHGVGKETAWNLYMYQLAVTKNACSQPGNEQWRALTVIPGVGLKSAEKLSHNFLVSCQPRPGSLL